jgi:peroxiredoxin
VEKVALWLLVSITLVAVFGLWLLVYQLVRQQGRLLLLFDSLNEQLQHAGANGFSANGASAPTEALRVGDTVPSFRLPSLAGETVALEQYRGKRVLLVNWSPNCSFCTMIAPDLAELQDDLHEHDTELVLVTYGDARANRKLLRTHGLNCPVLLRDGPDPVEAFRDLGTPAAYLVDEEGRIAEPLALGAEQVPPLARFAAGRRRRLARQRDVSESRIERNGLAAGTPAPPFALPTVDEGRVGLEDYRGRRVLLVFSDPNCGPCDELARQLAQIQREAGDDMPALLVVGRGDVEENRRKREEHGLACPFVVQQGWRVSKQYGIFATPVAFLIDEQGVIAADVAVGVDDIVALAEDARTAGKEAPIPG